MLNKVTDVRFNLGCDPEFFFKSKGEIIGAELVLPKNGLITPTANDTSKIKSKFIIDGVQGELNPAPSSCRALLAGGISDCFRELQNELNKNEKEVAVDFSRTVEISKEKLMELSEESRKFGCAPSQSIYKRIMGFKLKNVDPTEYRIRAAGGHIHLGTTDYTKDFRKAINNHPEKIVEMMDIICGNTAVLVDRDEGNIERRKVYGKAGEYRLPKHGLEYRTLSNFWLTAYPLMSFAFSLARLAAQLMSDPRKGASDEFYNEFTSKIKKDNVHKAINTNNFDLAVENFHAIEPLLLEVTSNHAADTYVVHSANIKEFKHFVNTIQEKGINHWFPNDPLVHWTGRGANNDRTYMGFNDFMRSTVRTDLAKVAKAA